MPSSMSICCLEKAERHIWQQKANLSNTATSWGYGLFFRTLQPRLASFRLIHIVQTWTEINVTCVVHNHCRKLSLRVEGLRFFPRRKMTAPVARFLPVSPNRIKHIIWTQRSVFNKWFAKSYHIMKIITLAKSPNEMSYCLQFWHNILKLKRAEF